MACPVPTDGVARCALQVGTYNPLPGQQWLTACRRCPEFSTTHEPGSAHVAQCECSEGFMQTGEHGAMACACGAGFEIIDGERCEVCGVGAWKSSVGNHKCTDCIVEHSTTQSLSDYIEIGATRASDCVCSAGFFAAAHATTHATTHAATSGSTSSTVPTGSGAGYECLACDSTHERRNEEYGTQRHNAEAAGARVLMRLC
jgi:hypothetical protein